MPRANVSYGVQGMMLVILGVQLGGIITADEDLLVHIRKGQYPPNHSIQNQSDSIDWIPHRCIVDSGATVDVAKFGFVC